MFDDYVGEMMKEEVAEHMEQLKSVGYENASLEDQYNMVINYQLMVEK